MTEYVDWQQKLADDFDVDGYMMPNETAKDFYAKFQNAILKGKNVGLEIASNLILSYAGQSAEVLIREIRYRKTPPEHPLDTL